jgi:hypothetical protein
MCKIIGAGNPFVLHIIDDCDRNPNLIYGKFGMEIPDFWEKCETLVLKISKNDFLIFNV